MIFYGPLPGLSTEYLQIDLAYYCIVALVSSSGFGFTVVSSFSRIQEASIQMNYVQDIKTHLFLNSLWTSFFFLANFCGSTFGGILIDYIGMRLTTAIFLTFNILTLIMDIYDYISFTKNIEYSALNCDE